MWGAGQVNLHTLALPLGWGGSQVVFNIAVPGRFPLCPLKLSFLGSDTK